MGVGGGVVPLLLANFSDALASLVLVEGNESVAKMRLLAKSTTPLFQSQHQV